MAVSRYYIDPDTKDHEIVNGAPRDDDTIASSVVLALAMERGSSPLLPNLGSRFHTLKKKTPDALELAWRYALEALDPLFQRGDLPELEVFTEYLGNELRVTVSYRQRNGKAKALTYSPRFGA